MNTELLLRILSCGLFAGVLGYMIFWRFDPDSGSEAHPDMGGQRYVPYGPYGNILPFGMVIFTGMLLLTRGFRDTILWNISTYLGIFLHISLYYVLLGATLPLLRRHFSARACAALWMVPNMLYITQMGYMTAEKPLLVLPLSRTAFLVLGLVWLAGFLGVLGHSVISHLVFRRRILRDAVPVNDPQVLDIWQQELSEARVRKPKMKLVISPKLTSPLSIGLLARSTRVVLPEKAYTPEQLRLVLRHELIHICRQDAATKFFLTFCTAMCWFNPLLWLARAKSAQDIELGCDETVLLEASPETRRQYADLILNTAGDDRGFTTCLSASAATVRYRLKNIVKPRQLKTGAILVGLVFFVLSMTCGCTAVAVGTESGREALLGGKPEAVTFESIHAGSESYVCREPEAVLDTLGKLTLRPFGGNFRLEQGKILNMGLTVDGNYKIVDIYPEYVSVYQWTDSFKGQKFYKLDEAFDLEGFLSHLVPLPRAKVTFPQLHTDLTATVTKFTVSGQMLPIQETGGSFSGVGYDMLPDRAELDFPAAADYVLRTEEGKILSQGWLEGVTEVPLDSKPNTYYLTLSWEDGEPFQGEFAFQVNMLTPEP